MTRIDTTNLASLRVVRGVDVIPNQQQALISPRGAMTSAPKELLAWFEPVFSASESSRLRFPPEIHERTAEHLRHRIAGDPADLRSHVRRIIIGYESANAPELYGALVDLFLSLGTRGVELRDRMVGLARSSLTVHQHDLLKGALAKGIDETRLPSPATSVLGKGLIGTPELIKPVLACTPNPRDPLTEALEFLEYSQVDQARKLLENAILNQPHEPGLHSELLAIYRSSRDKTNFTKMRDRLSGGLNPLPAEWGETDAFLRKLDD